jgi:hypothetical protein
MKTLIIPIAVAAMLGCSHPGPPPAADADAASAAAEASEAAAAAARNAAAAASLVWKYHEDTDAATNQKSAYATVNSSNTIEFGFPYAGAQRATLLVQPRTHSPAIRLIIEHGQFLCRSSTDGSNGCFVPVKFDNGGLDIWYAQLPTDGRTNVIDFGKPEDDPKSGTICIADELARTKSLTLRVTFYYEGDRTIEFNVGGFDRLPMPAVSPSKKQLEDCRAKNGH